METLIASLKILFLLASLGLILGFIRPVLVLWFMHRCNRLMVLQYYGIPALLLFLGLLSLGE
ncbi:hypothetical protein [Cyclobacterium plantarum]|uniref:hypothetical protein n=1 Tax=Cyclobacterium plantarum TaxID=2716263 RepID=UPI003F71FA21